ncbi:MAG: hypothetical protein JWN46_1252 [Acidimicrobiales bacterium]|nr:hypothetical protein [Acidimicrobiales bacterium]
MDFEIVVPEPDDFPGPMTPVFTAFGQAEITDEELEDERLQWDTMRPLSAKQGDEWLAGAADYPFELTLPGGSTVAAAGVTMVGVHPAHRRRGLLTALMERQLDEVARRGEPVAVLTASESSIYGRFGYGEATASLGIEIETAYARFTTPPAAPGRCRLVSDRAEATALASTAYERYRPLRPGSVTRMDWHWEFGRRDRKRWRDGASASFWLIHEGADGQPDGFATYRIRDSYVDLIPRSTAIVDDLLGVDAEVEAALWRFILDLDLIQKVECARRPVDESIRWRLAEPRRLRTKPMLDWVWVRILDVPTTLAARQYAVDGGLVLEVIDRFRPVSGGRFALAASPAGASCARTTAPADLTLGAADLGALVLGGVAPSTLAAAARIDEHSPGALARADLLFPSRPAPFCNTRF